MKRLLIIGLLLICSLNVEGAKYKQVLNIRPFEQTKICFNPDLYPDGVNQKDGLIILGNGRIVLKKVLIPKYTRDISITAKMRLVSDGDSWDKSGSCFVIPTSSIINMIEVAAGKASYPRSDSTKYEDLKGIVSEVGYQPTVELMRFMTPFGVGHFSSKDTTETNGRLPVYIDEWADCVEWEQDITDLYYLLEGEVYIGVFIDTWTSQGYKVSLDVSIDESTLFRDKLVKQKVLPLVNTIHYLDQKTPDIFSRRPLEIPFEIPEGAKNIRLNYIVTGHGGHSGGDEFSQKENIITVDGGEIFRYIPWRNDCASFRRYNPTAGVWLQPREVYYIGSQGRDVKEIEEPIASSDFSRSNWCPGSDVPPLTLVLDDLLPGRHILTIAIPQAQPAEGDKLNHWLVSAYLVWEE